jgi:hypothetical protein
MTRFGKKSFIWLAVGSIAVAGGLVAYTVVHNSAEKTHQAMQQLVQSEAEFVRVKAQLAKWEKARASGSVVMPRVEPVSLTASFAPDEVLDISRVLGGMYAEHGYLNLKSFTLTRSGASLQVAVLGDKVFLQ